MTVTALVATPLAAQNPATEFVTNGTFTSTLIPWVMGGAYSVNPGLESGINVTGTGISDSFGVNAGGQVTPPPYAPNTLEQSVSLNVGVTYEFRMDAVGYRNSTTANSDIGTIWVEINDVEIARHAFGSYTSPQVKLAQLCGRYTATSTGSVVLRLFFQRAFLAGAVNPRMNIDNVSLMDTTGPTFCMAGNRLPGATVALRVNGAANLPYAVFLSPSLLQPGIPLPGFNGLLFLNPASLFLLVSGGLDANGAASTPLPLPYDIYHPPLYFQPITVGGATNRNELGYSACQKLTY